jgi:hypothetical protein
LFEVLAEAAVTAEPCQCSFHDPAAGQDLEALCGIGPLDDLDAPSADAAQGLAQLVAGIAAIGEQVAQPRDAADDCSEQQRRPVTVLDIGGVGFNQQRPAIGIDQSMALAAFDFLARVIAPRAAALGGFDALAVDDGCARTGFALRAASPRPGQALGVDPQPGVAAFMR